jgi:hypothetical protein
MPAQLQSNWYGSRLISPLGKLPTRPITRKTCLLPHGNGNAHRLNQWKAKKNEAFVDLKGHADAQTDNPTQINDTIQTPSKTVTTLTTTHYPVYCKKGISPQRADIISKTGRWRLPSIETKKNTRRPGKDVHPYVVRTCQNSSATRPNSETERSHTPQLSIQMILH